MAYGKIVGASADNVVKGAGVVTMVLVTAGATPTQTTLFDGTQAGGSAILQFTPAASTCFAVPIPKTGLEFKTSLSATLGTNVTLSLAVE